LGKGDEKYMELCDKKIPFSDKEAVFEVISWNCDKISNKIFDLILI
jgi:hypothetical protein